MSSLMLATATDSYKGSHWKQYPPGTEIVRSYAEARSSSKNQLLYVGFQSILHRLAEMELGLPSYVMETWNKHVGPGVFNYEGWQKLRDRGLRNLPIEIRSLPEGTVVPPGVPLFVVENNDPEFYWLTNWIETMLVRAWYPMAVGTNSWHIYNYFTKMLFSCGVPAAEVSGIVPFMLHDFGYRGCSSDESARIGGAAHLLSGFMGTDTMAALHEIKYTYTTDDMIAFSIPAMEHSTVTSWGEDGECDAFENMIDVFPEDAIIACVSDSYDIERACKEYWGKRLKEKVLQRSGRVVVRPDSGDPVEMSRKVFEWLWEAYKEHGTYREVGGETWRVLPPQIRVIYGDGINPRSIQAICENLYNGGISVENFAFGMGSGMLQEVTRDDHSFALKCCGIQVNGEWRDVSKNPASDSGKRSKSGDLTTFRCGTTGELYASVRGNPRGKGDTDMMQVVYRNGRILKSWTAQEVRKNASSTQWAP